MADFWRWTRNANDFDRLGIEFFEAGSVSRMIIATW